MAGNCPLTCCTYPGIGMSDTPRVRTETKARHKRNNQNRASPDPDGPYQPQLQYSYAKGWPGAKRGQTQATATAPKHNRAAFGTANS